MRIDPQANVEAFTKLADKSGEVQMQVGIGVMKHRRWRPPSRRRSSCSRACGRTSARTSTSGSSRSRALAA